jgi:hypothetical protein
MRTVFWSGTLATILVASAVYLAAERMQQPSVGDCAAAPEVTGTSSFTPEGDPPIMCLPEEVVLPLPSPPPLDSELIQAGLSTPAATPPLNALPSFEVDWAVSVGPEAVVVPARPEARMPYCRDEDGPAPATMPYLNDATDPGVLPDLSEAALLPSAGREDAVRRKILNLANAFLQTTGPAPVAGGGTIIQLGYEEEPTGTRAAGMRREVPRESATSRPRVDTTEFRPGDGGHGEFGRIPF